MGLGTKALDVVGVMGGLDTEAMVRSLLAFVWLMHCQGLMHTGYFFERLWLMASESILTAVRCQS